MKQCLLPWRYHPTHAVQGTKRIQLNFISNELNVILVLPESLLETEATSTEAASPESPLDLEALKEITRKVSRYEVIDPSVVDSLVEISHYLQQLSREQEARCNDSGVGRPPPVKRSKASVSGSGEIRPVPPSGSRRWEWAGSHRTNRGARHQGDHTDTRRSLPPGSSRTYKTERPGRTSQQYETTSQVSEQIATSRRHEILNSLTSNEFGEYISQLPSASHNISLEFGSWYGRPVHMRLMWRLHTVVGVDGSAMVSMLMARHSRRTTQVFVFCLHRLPNQIHKNEVLKIQILQRMHASEGNTPGQSCKVGRSLGQSLTGRV